MAAKKIPIPLHRRFDGFRRSALPLLVWLAAVAGVIHLLELRDASAEYFGLAEVGDFVVAAPADGTLAELPVGLYDEVAAGQVVAMMDPAPLLARIRTAAAEAERLVVERQAVSVELEAAAAEIDRGWEKDARRFQVDAADLRVQLLRVRVDLETGRVEAERRRVAYERARLLVESTVLSEAEAEDLRLAHEVELERIRTTAAVVAQLDAEHRLAVERSRAFLASAPEQLVVLPRLEALQQAVQVQELRLAEIELARAGLVLRAPASGQVRSLLASPGRALVLGQGILALTPAAGQAVVFYLPPNGAEQVSLGDPVLVRRPSGLDKAEAIVAALSPTIEELPRLLWRDPAVPEFGRAARLSPLPGFGLVPGEAVRVALNRP